MIEIRQALDLIEKQCRPLPSTEVSLIDAVDRITARPISSDTDSPPFDKSMMDGFAVRAADVRPGARLKIIERVPAGAVPQHSVSSGQATQIMTGAPVPQGADAVIMIEQTRELESDGGPQVEIDAGPCLQGQNIMRQGTAMCLGDEVFPNGKLIRPEDVGLLAEAGCARCHVIPKPTMSIVATGDELIPIEGKPIGSQIRNSNGPMLSALAATHCQRVTDLGIGIDDHQALSQVIGQGLESNVLVLSGGVSAGVADLVPNVLGELGVRQIFHKVRIKPGKPIWFGLLDRTAGTNTLVFGLPGNPVSSLVCFGVFVAPALRRLAGRRVSTGSLKASLSKPFTQKPGRTTYWPSRLRQTGDAWQVEPLDWKGSADLKTLAMANAFAVFEGSQTEFESGREVDILKMTR